jgi:hypothetical protein
VRRSDIMPGVRNWLWRINYARVNCKVVLKGVSGLFLSLTLLFATPVFASTPGNVTAAGRLALTPTVECIGVVADYTGDDNQNSIATLEYREISGAWQTAPGMYVDRADHQYRGSIFWLTANTGYEVRVTFTDPDGVSGVNPITGATETRDDNPPGNGRSFYVAANGSDANPGTLVEPLKTIQKAASAVKAGDTVYVKGGTYHETVIIPVSGTKNNYITFRSHNSDAVLINGGFVIDGISFVRIKGFIIDNPTTGILISNDADGVIVEDNNITNSGSNSNSAIRIDYGSQNTLVQRNTLTINNPAGIEDKDGVYWWKAGGGHVFKENILTGSPWDGFGGGPEDLDTTANDYDFYGNEISGVLDDGIQPDGGNINTRVWNNIIHNSFSGVSLCPVLKGPAYVFRNLVYDLRYRSSPGDDGAIKLGDGSFGRLYFYHNTLVGTNQNDSLFATNAGLGNIVSRNNVYLASWYVIEFGHSYDAQNHDFDYDNLRSINSTGRFLKWGEAKYENFASFTADTGQEQHGLSVDSEFVNQAGGDFRLQPGSPNIDVGALLPGFNDASSPWPYRGSSPDLGAYEYGLESPVFTPAPVPSSDPTPAPTPSVEPAPTFPVSASLTTPAATTDTEPLSSLTPTAAPARPVAVNWWPGIIVVIIITGVVVWRLLARKSGL